MRVGQLADRLAAGDQVIRRPALGEQQAEHLLVDPGLLAQRLGLRAGALSRRLARSKSVPNQAHSPSPSPFTSPKPVRALSGVELR